LGLALTRWESRIEGRETYGVTLPAGPVGWRTVAYAKGNAIYITQDLGIGSRELRSF